MGGGSGPDVVVKKASTFLESRLFFALLSTPAHPRRNLA